MQAPFRYLRIAFLLAAFLVLGAVACPFVGTTSRTLYYDVTLGGQTVEVRFHHWVTVGNWQYDFYWEFSIRDPTTGQYRAATYEEERAIIQQIHVPTWEFAPGWFVRASGGSVMPKPAPSPPTVPQ